jgi:hypothetical protein
VDYALSIPSHSGGFAMQLVADETESNVHDFLVVPLPSTNFLH